MKDKEYKNILLKKYHDYSLEENQSKKKLLQFEIENISKHVKNLDSEDYYILGSIYYFANDDKDYNLNIALEKFLHAYELDSKNYLACLYIAHCFHDKKDLTSALLYYEKVDASKLKEFQIWRYVKLIEQIGYCHFKLGRKEIGRQKFEEVLTWYKKPNLGHLAVPSEIIECLDESDQIVKEIKEIETYLK